MNFSEALDALNDGSKVTREGWNGPGQFVALQTPDEHSKMGQPYLYLSPVNGKLVPWTPSTGDLFARDWAVVPE